MKKYFYLVAITLGVLVSACNGQSKNKVNATDAQNQAEVMGENLIVDTQASSINWKGFKPGGSHHGTISVKEGSLVTGANDSLAGSFVIDMNSIINEDLTDAETNAKLVGHLKSADFFDVEKYPTSNFVITNVKPLATANDSVTHIISGNLKMKDAEKNISFGAKVTKDGTKYTAKSVPFTIDRSQWNIKYGSKSFFDDLKDNFINDEIELQITIVANPASK